MRPLFVAIMLSALLTAPALACGPKPNGPQIPPLAATLDKLLPNAKLADAEMETLRGLRAEITKLAADQKLREARVVEEQAMKLLGYRKVIFRCGGGIPVWIKIRPKTTTLTAVDA
jgi:hypothetical protein